MALSAGKYPACCPISSIKQLSLSTRLWCFHGPNYLSWPIKRYWVSCYSL